jgi:hypothetical protein
VADEKRLEKKLPVSVLSQYWHVTSARLETGRSQWSAISPRSRSRGGGKQQVFHVQQCLRVSSTEARSRCRPKKNNAVTHFLLTIVEGDFRADRK